MLPIKVEPSMRMLGKDGSSFANHFDALSISCAIADTRAASDATAKQRRQSLIITVPGGVENP
jgi:hypothetical protein